MGLEDMIVELEATMEEQTAFSDPDHPSEPLQFCDADGPSTENPDHRSLLRAIRLLQELFRTYREASFDLSIDSLEVNSEGLVLREGDYDGAGTQMVVDFPYELVKNYEPWVQKLILNMNACTAPCVDVQQISATFLRDVEFVQKIEEVDLQVKRGPRQWIFYRPTGDITDQSYDHTTYRITLQDGSRWVLDLTASQYGYEDTIANILVPWQIYLDERVELVLKICNFGAKANSSRGCPLDCVCGIDCPLYTGWHAPNSIGMAMEVEVIMALAERGITAEDLLTKTSEEEFAQLKCFVVAAGRRAMEEYKRFWAPSAKVKADNSAWLAEAEPRKSVKSRVRKMLGGLGTSLSSWVHAMNMASRAKAVLGPSKLNMETSKEKQMKLIEKVEISGNSGFPILRSRLGRDGDAFFDSERATSADFLAWHLQEQIEEQTANRATMY